MKRIAVFCIPAHGHTNPILPVVTELVRRGDRVRFYSFAPFKDKIEATGAKYVSCDAYLAPLTEKQAEKLKKVSITEMTIQDIRLTLAMNDFLQNEFLSFCPDVVYTDSACFWGKLNALKFNVPMVVSTSTFAFNRMSSQYMKNSPAEIAGLVFGLPRATRELNKLKPYGYRFKSLLQLVQSDNDTDSVVYTSKAFQPFSESFSEHYLFSGPSLFADREKRPEKNATRPLVYISLGTVINDRPGFYKTCVEALKDEAVDVLISCGGAVKPESLGDLPENVRVFPRVDQLDVLSGASVFLTHCGMNSVSESLFMATPMVLYPQTNEQRAVARRAHEIGAGEYLKDDSAEGIRKTVRRILDDPSYADAAKKCSDDFRSCPGVAAAAQFIENAPHTTDGKDVMKSLAKASAVWQIVYNVAKILLGIVVFRFLDRRFLWLYILLAVLLGSPVNRLLQNATYRRLVKKDRRT